jgi:hypothetical protein
MYENITYAELKTLPKEEKAVAWKELKGLYSTQKELAEKLGVSPNLVYNMISRYVKNGPAGTEIADGQEAAGQAKKAARRARRRDGRATDNNTVTEVSGTVRSINFSGENESFSISIKKTVSGEDAQFLLSGIGGTLLKNQKYLVEVKIIEE